jgi:monoamine oxidase
MTRRTFLERVGQVGGGVAMHRAMHALQLAGPVSTLAFAPHGRAPRGTRVIVLGAGLAGLATAYELNKLGYACEVLEARSRPGGRCFTIRQGTMSEEDGPPQKAAFDEGLYLNAGPARIPHHHATTLAYCRELGIALEMFCSVNEAAYVHERATTTTASANATSASAAGGAADVGAGRGRKMRLRELHADWRGYTSELLAKAVSQESLDRPMTREDRDRLVEWLTKEGALGADRRYAGSPRRGYRAAPGAGNAAGLVDDPLALDDLVRTGFGQHLTTDLNLQTPMFQPVGGMDQIAKALAARVPHVKYGAEVQAIEQPAGRVRVRYRDTSSGATHVLDGTYCVCALPLSILRTLAVDVSPEMKAAIGAVNYATAGKIGLQFARRFWEEDEGIYGGITKTDLEISQILYPNYGYLSKKGVLVGYYQNGVTARATGDLPPAERLSRAIEQGTQIHPQYPREFETAFSIAWHRVRYQHGSWAQFTEAQRRSEYQRLLQPDRALYLAGDHVTYAIAWMQGAFESARSVVSALHERASREATAASTTASSH